MQKKSSQLTAILSSSNIWRTRLRNQNSVIRLIMNFQSCLGKIHLYNLEINDQNLLYSSYVKKEPLNILELTVDLINTIPLAPDSTLWNRLLSGPFFNSALIDSTSCARHESISSSKSFFSVSGFSPPLLLSWKKKFHHVKLCLEI